jgi:large subunit ribosomal protein L35
MPKLKTKSGAKKRFKVTGTGKVMAAAAGKRHRLISHNGKYIRQNRGTSALSDQDARTIKKFLPYA